MPIKEILSAIIYLHRFWFVLVTILNDDCKKFSPCKFIKGGTPIELLILFWMSSFSVETISSENMIIPIATDSPPEAESQFTSLVQKARISEKRIRK